MSAIERQVRGAATVDAHVALQGAVGDGHVGGGGALHLKQKVVAGKQTSVVQHLYLRRHTGISEDRRARLPLHQDIVEPQFGAVAHTFGVSPQANAIRATGNAATRGPYISTKRIQTDPVRSGCGNLCIGQLHKAATTGFDPGGYALDPAIVDHGSRTGGGSTDPVDEHAHAGAGYRGTRQTTTGVGERNPWTAQTAVVGTAHRIELCSAGDQHLKGGRAIGIQYAAVPGEIVVLRCGLIDAQCLTRVDRGQRKHQGT
ncbi:hypothetical protein D3C84_299260 [compost metagenome]